MQQATNAILRGGTIMTPSVSAKTIAEQLAEKINAKLNYTPVEKLEEERQAAEQVETVTRYEEELEINDFPQVSSTQTSPVLNRFWTLPLPGKEINIPFTPRLISRLQGGKWHLKKPCRGSVNILKLPSPSGELISLQAKSPKRENARSTWLLKVCQPSLYLRLCPLKPTKYTLSFPVYTILISLRRINA